MRISSSSPDRFCFREATASSPRSLTTGNCSSPPRVCRLAGCDNIFSPGDRVAVEPGVPCHLSAARHPYVFRGRYNLVSSWHRGSLSAPRRLPAAALLLLSGSTRPSSTCSFLRPSLLSRHLSQDPGLRFHATPPVHGSLARLIDHPVQWLHRIPPSLTYEEAALCEPLSVGIHACRRAGVTTGAQTKGAGR